MSEGLFYPEEVKKILHALELKMEDVSYERLKKLDGWIDDFKIESERAGVENAEPRLY